jgi:sugar lactone lactonase YvrE
VRPPSPELVVADTFEHPESIVWDCARRRLLWVDVFKGELWSYDLVNGSLDVTLLGQAVGSVALRRGGGLICAVREGFAVLSEAGELSVTSPHLRSKPHLQMNDGAVDPRGRFWAGSMGTETPRPEGAASLYRLDLDGRVTEVLGGVSISNGIGWSPDSTRCYYVDSATRRIDAFEFDLERGTLSGRRPHAIFDAYPDGIAVDVDGCVWVALFEGSEVRRLTPSGTVDRVVRLPGTQVTTCAFGGDNCDTLFIAVSRLGLGERALSEQKGGHIFALDAGVAGLPSHEFLG